MDEEDPSRRLEKCESVLAERAPHRGRGRTLLYLRSVRSVLLTGTEHWVTVNRLIVTHMDEDVYKTVESLIPENHADLGALNPAVLL